MPFMPVGMPPGVSLAGSVPGRLWRYLDLLGLAAVLAVFALVFAVLAAAFAAAFSALVGLAVLAWAVVDVLVLAVVPATAGTAMMLRAAKEAIRLRFTIHSPGVGRPRIEPRLP